MKLKEIITESQILTEDETFLMEVSSALAEVADPRVDPKKQEKLLKVLQKYFPTTEPTVEGAVKEIVAYLRPRFEQGRASSLARTVVSDIIGFIDRYHIKTDYDTQLALSRMNRGAAVGPAKTYSDASLEKKFYESHDGVTTEQVMNMIIGRIMHNAGKHMDLLAAGPDAVAQAALSVAEDIASSYSAGDEIGSSDISAFVDRVRQELGIERSMAEGMFNPARYRVTMPDGKVHMIDWKYDEGLGQYFIDTYGQEPAKIERVKNIKGATAGGATRDAEANKQERADAERAAFDRAQASYERR